MTQTRSNLKNRSNLIGCTAIGAIVVCSALLAGCGSSGTPTSVPTPVATPTPTPTPTPDPNVPPVGSGCKQPYPPKITRLTVKIQYKLTDYWILDSTPLVGPDALYCQTIGFTDGRQFCPVRPEGVADRPACENWRAGIAKDTGKPGPTWTYTPNGGSPKYCTGPASGCEHVPDAEFNLRVYTGGLYRVCTADNVCDEVDTDRNL